MNAYFVSALLADKRVQKTQLRRNGHRLQMTWNSTWWHVKRLGTLKYEQDLNVQYTCLYKRPEFVTNQSSMTIIPTKMESYQHPHKQLNKSVRYGGLDPL